MPAHKKLSIQLDGFFVKSKYHCRMKQKKTCAWSVSSYLYDYFKQAHFKSEYVPGGYAFFHCIKYSFEYCFEKSYLISQEFNVF